jgi:hypothetical protein
VSDGAVEMGKHRIEVNCPHVADGACSACMWPQIVPYVAARLALDDLLPKFKLLSEALRSLASDAERVAKGTDKLHEWVELRAAEKWELRATDAGDKEPTP